MSYTVYRRPCANHPKSNVKLPSGLYQCLRCVVPEALPEPDVEIRRDQVRLDPNAPFGTTVAEQTARLQEQANIAAMMQQEEDNRRQQRAQRMMNYDPWNDPEQFREPDGR